jgi:hypothetical protein
MEWTAPSFEEIAMNAEIGGYQGDDAPPIVTDEPAEDAG